MSVIGQCPIMNTMSDIGHFLLLTSSLLLLPPDLPAYLHSIIYNGGANHVNRIAFCEPTPYAWFFVSIFDFGIHVFSSGMIFKKRISFSCFLSASKNMDRGGEVPKCLFNIILIIGLLAACECVALAGLREVSEEGLKQYL